MMPANKSEFDTCVVVGLVVVFALPLTLLLPGFSLWAVVPKLRVTRYLGLVRHLTWSQLNAVITTLVVLFFCLYLEIRKRKLDDLVEHVLTVSQATDQLMEVERGRQASAMHACADLLDASAEHYEHLMLLRDDLRKRASKQHPPVIEPSCSNM